MSRWASRGGEKLEAALEAWRALMPSLQDRVAADFGANVGGFTDCLLAHGVRRVYAIDTGYGVLAWKLRTDERVVVMERTNALHVELPEPVDLVTIDAAWTRQRHAIPAALRVLAPEGRIVTLVKPHYEAEDRLPRGGVLDDEAIPSVLDAVRDDIVTTGGEIEAAMPSPILGAKGNREFLWLVKRARG